MSITLCILLKPTGYVTHQQVKNSTIVPSVHTVFMCFVFIWEQTATYAPYKKTDRFLSEKKSVYKAVLAGSLNKAVCASSLKGYYHSLTETHITFKQNNGVCCHDVNSLVMRI
jgi:hypothetical protein